MTAGFRRRLAESASGGGPIILAVDIEGSSDMVSDALGVVDRLRGHICAIKMNLQLLLPLGLEGIQKITAGAKKLDLQCIADIKLNDIGNTNAAASGILWRAGFDALIANPIMGPSALSALVASAHASDRGIISLCHMSSHEGAVSYEMQVGGRPLYKKFLEWGLAAGVDGVVVGATFPEIIRGCRQDAGDRADIVSPGVGAQGGSARTAIDRGSDYIIVGRSIINSEDPAETARTILLS